MARPAPAPTPAAAAAHRRLGYIGALDGLRGLSVLGPLLFHARPDDVPGGFLTVDLFFVLSSYLIVSIALRELDSTGRLDLLAYAGRRVRRLLPAMLVCLLFVTGWLVIRGTYDDLARVTGSVVASLTYTANWYQIAAGTSYFEQFATPSPLRHVWSLAIEEQFYLVAPFLLIAVHRLARAPRRTLVVVAGVGAAASAALMSLLYHGGDPSRVYYGTDTRAQALLVGIGLAALTHGRKGPTAAWARRTMLVASHVAVAGFAVAMLRVGEHSRWLFDDGGFLAVSLAAGLVVWTVAQPWRSPLHSLLRTPPLRGLGRITYGVYLYHLPLFVLVVTQPRLTRSWWWVAAGGAITLAVATVSYVVVERPFVHRRWPVLASMPVRPVPAAAAFTGAVALLAGGLVLANTTIHSDRLAVAAPTLEELRPPTTTAAPGAAAPLRVLVVGDSVMTQLGVGLQRYAKAHPDELVVFNHAHLGCLVTRGGQVRTPDQSVADVLPACAWDQRVAPGVVTGDVVSFATAVEVFRPDVVVGGVSAWDVADRKVPALGDRWTNVGDPTFDAWATDEYRAATQLLASTGARVLWLAGPHLNRPVTPQNSPERVDRLNGLVDRAIAGVPGATLVDLPGWLGPAGTDRDKRLRPDGLHYSVPGLDEVADWLVHDVLPAH